MATTLSSTLLQIHHQTPPKKPISRKLTNTILCNSSSSSSSSPPIDLASQNQNPQSLSQQLKPISTNTLPNTPPKTHLKSKPRSTWVNPTRPRPSVLTLQRQKKNNQYTYNPQIRDLKQFARKLNESEPNESVYDQIPHPLSRENTLLLLNNIRPWQKTVSFFNWVKTHDLFPMETIFYNVVMKSLRFGREFGIIEELANEMVENGVELDNITYSTIITCAKRCGLFDKAVEWFERMYKTGVMPDEVTYSAVLDVYANLGKVEEVMSLYERGRASGWNPDPIAFSVLAKMFGEVGDYDGIRFVLEEMKSIDVAPNLVVYNTLLEAMGKTGKPGLARSLFEEMVDSGITPNEKTLTSLVKIYGKARWGRDALDLWEKMKLNNWPMDFFLYNTLLSMCADLGLEEDGEKLFEDMKVSGKSKPDTWSYTAMLNIYGSGGNVDKAMGLFEEMSKFGVDINIMGYTCLIQCLGRAKRIDDLVRVFDDSVKRGIKPDDRLSGCLLSVVSYCEKKEDEKKVMSCLEKANPGLVSFINLLEDDKVDFENVKEEFKRVLSVAMVDCRRPFCNCLIDICRNRKQYERAHELLYVGTVYGLYPGLHTKTNEEWRLNVRSLSIGAAFTALEEWMSSVMKLIEKKEELPELFSATTGAGTHKYSQGLASAFENRAKELEVPFIQSEDKAGLFVASRDDLVSWAESKLYSLTPAI